MQEAEELLNLQYTKGQYGPYANNLRHVLNAIEGHLVSGYSDGGDAPSKPIELVPGALKDAEQFLSERRETLDRLDSVHNLIDGFETPFGLELLATVHWVVKHEQVTNVEDTTTKFYDLESTEETLLSTSGGHCIRNSQQKKMASGWDCYSAVTKTTLRSKVAQLLNRHIRHAFEVIMQRAHVITGHLCVRQLYTNPRYRFSGHGIGAA